MCDELEAMGGGDTRVGRVQTFCRMCPHRCESKVGTSLPNQVVWIERQPAGEGPGDMDHVVTRDTDSPSSSSEQVFISVTTSMVRLACLHESQTQIV